MTQGYHVDIAKALALLKTVEEFGAKPEIKPALEQAHRQFVESFLGLLVTAAQEGIIPNTSESNDAFLRKILIAFDMGYYAKTMEVKN